MSSTDLRLRRGAHHYTHRGQSTEHLLVTLRLAASELGFPSAQINIQDDTTQYLICGYGMDGPDRMPREQTVCQYTIATEHIVAVGDLAADARFASLPGVQRGVARSYVGIPVRSRESTVVGTLCVFDSVVRTITDQQINKLQEFAHIVEDQLDLMRRLRQLRTGVPGESADLVRAIETAEIVPWYQPVADLWTGETRSYEALARWVHPDGEITDPAQFIPIAEDSDVVVDLDLAIMRQALRDLRRWRQAGHETLMNVNLSTRHLEILGGVDEIAAVVRDAGVDPSLVNLELTETHRFADPELAAVAVLDLRSLGFRVLLDDFGSGWSSLDWVMQLPVTGLKIDRSVTAALTSRVGQAVTRAATGLARDLDLTLVLEGIASYEDLVAARSMGYRYGQGYYWSPPVPADCINP